MKNKTLIKTIVLLVAVGLVLPACQTTGESTGLGAGLGAVAGAVIGNQSGNPITGAIIGAAAGGLAGYMIGKVHEKQLASRKQVEQQIVNDGGTVPAQPTVKIEDLTSTPSKVKPGDTVDIVGTYAAYGGGNEAPKGKLRLLHDGKELGSDNLKVTQVGRSQFSRKMQIPKNMAAGEYTVEVQMARGQTVQTRTTTIEVA